jgi:hypothetical protein
MGRYINPRNMTKENWLETFGKILEDAPHKFGEYEDCLSVVLVENGGFTAAAIAFSQQELETFTMHDDLRAKKFYTVPTEVLRQHGFF